MQLLVISGGPYHRMCSQLTAPWLASGWAPQHPQGLLSMHVLNRFLRGQPAPHLPPGTHTPCGTTDWAWSPCGHPLHAGGPGLAHWLEWQKAAARAKCQKGSKHFILLIFFPFLIKLNSKTKIHKLPCPPPPPSPPRSLRRWLPFLHPTHTDTGYPTEKTKLL